jgi:hypothetical protein
MSYLEKSLAPDEIVMVRGEWPTIHWIGAWAALLFLGIFVVGIVIFLRSWAVMSTTEFAVTNRRVVLKRGWFNTSTQELAVESVEGVRLTQSFWGKIFGYGHVIVTGTGDARIVFPPMAHPVTFRRAIEAGRGIPMKCIWPSKTATASMPRKTMRLCRKAARAPNQFLASGRAVSLASASAKATRFA